MYIRNLLCVEADSLSKMTICEVIICFSIFLIVMWLITFLEDTIDIIRKFKKQYKKRRYNKLKSIVKQILKENESNGI